MSCSHSFLEQISNNWPHVAALYVQLFTVQNRNQNMQKTFIYTYAQVGRTVAVSTSRS
jgi:hypothetical protein